MTDPGGAAHGVGHGVCHDVCHGRPRPGHDGSVPDPLVEHAAAWDRAVATTPGIDPFCSSTDWSFAAAAAFPQWGPPTVTGVGAALVGTRPLRHDDGLLVRYGLDPLWGFATPVVGPAADAGRAVAEHLADLRWDACVLTGQDRDLPLTRAVVAALADRFDLGMGPEEHRMRADLAPGFDAWLARRTPRFRQRLRRLEREAESHGLRLEALDPHGPPEAVLARCCAVEERSWKGAQGSGLTDPVLATFYRAALGRLGPGGRIRALVAVLHGEDVGFVLGGVRGGTYRGFQLAYDAAHEQLGLGHLLQAAQLRALDAEGGIATYDLGMRMPYKERWADRVDTTFALVVRR